MPLRRAELPVQPAPPTAGFAFHLAELDSEDADARRGAAIALGQHAAEHGAEPSILAAFAAQLQTEPDRAVREAVFTALVTIGGGDAAALLGPLLRAEDAGLRNGAVETLRRLRDDAVPVVDRLLQDADGDVRYLTIEALRGWPPELAVPRLQALLTAETHVNVMGAALDVAAAAGDARLLPALATAQARFAGEGFVEFAIAEAIHTLAARPAESPPAAPASRGKPARKKPAAKNPRKTAP
jgi:HEAT repeat protein